MENIRRICFVGVEHRAFYDFTPERIGTVENEESDLAFGGFLHAIAIVAVYV